MIMLQNKLLSLPNIGSKKNYFNFFKNIAIF